MIRFAAVLPPAYVLCAGDEECLEPCTVYVWDDADHQGCGADSDLCDLCWNGHASCVDESHIARVIQDVSNTSPGETSRLIARALGA